MKRIFVLAIILVLVSSLIPLVTAGDGSGGTVEDGDLVMAVGFDFYLVPPDDFEDNYVNEEGRVVIPQGTIIDFDLVVELRAHLFQVTIIDFLTSTTGTVTLPSGDVIAVEVIGNPVSEDLLPLDDPLPVEDEDIVIRGLTKNEGTMEILSVDHHIANGIDYEFSTDDPGVSFAGSGIEGNLDAYAHYSPDEIWDMFMDQLENNDYHSIQLDLDIHPCSFDTSSYSLGEHVVTLTYDYDLLYDGPAEKYYPFEIVPQNPPVDDDDDGDEIIPPKEVTFGSILALLKNGEINVFQAIVQIFLLFLKN